MTKDEQDYLDANHDEQAALQYQVDNGAISAEDAGLDRKPESDETETEHGTE